jgi:hypothetical protein
MLIREATLADAVWLADHLREEDLRELNSAQSGRLPKAILARALGVSSYAFVAQKPEGLVCIGGVAPIGDGAGSAWLLGSDLMTGNKLALGRVSRQCVDLMHRDHRIIYNHADSRNALHLRWLRWCGFKELPPTTTFAEDGTPFIPFFRIKD